VATITRTETRKRGVIGKILLWLFFLFNGLMVWWVIAGLGGTGEMMTTATSEAERGGMALGAAIGFGFIIVIWAAGAVILGLLVLLTPGKTIITESRKD
jgi:hypothetical protein